MATKVSISKILFFCCLAFIFGLFVGSLVSFPKSILIGFFILGAIFIFLSVWSRFTIKFLSTFGYVLGMLVIFFAFGVFRYDLAEVKFSKSPLLYLSHKKAQVIVVGKVVSSPDIRLKSQRLKIKPNKIVDLETSTTVYDYDIDGYILIYLPRYSEYSYGDVLEISGKLETSPDLEDFNYKNYLKKDGIYSIIYWPEVKILDKKNLASLPSKMYSMVLTIKDKLRESIYQNISPPQSIILGAIILGDKSNLSSELKQNLNRAGVRHITAISGMHVAIMTTILMIFMISIGFWRQQAFYLTLIIIALFVVMTGFQPSAIRAAIMSSFLLLAQHVGRIGDASRAVILSATLMLAINPFLLKFDVGFQLSFAAIMGIIYFGPIIRNWLNTISDFMKLKSVFIMSISAFIFTAPILIYNFGQISLIGILANLLIVPLLPLVMIGGFVFALAGIIWPLLGQIFSWPVWLLLTYITKTTEWLASFPLAALNLQNVHWIWIWLVYFILIFVTWKLRQRIKFKFLSPI